MAVRIEELVDVNKKVHKRQCPGCKSVISFQTEDVQRTYDSFGDLESQYVVCPNCDEKIGALMI